MKYPKLKKTSTPKQSGKAFSNERQHNENEMKDRNLQAPLKNGGIEGLLPFQLFRGLLDLFKEEFERILKLLYPATPSPTSEQLEDRFRYLVQLFECYYRENRKKNRDIYYNKLKKEGLRLPNAAAGKEYSETILVEIDGITVENCDALEGTGLVAAINKVQPDTTPDRTDITVQEAKAKEGQGESQSKFEENGGGESDLIQGNLASQFLSKAETAEKRTFEVTVKGIPIYQEDSEGEASLKLKCKYNGWNVGDPLLEYEIGFAIIQDPRTLWKEMEVSPDILYPKDNVYSKLVTVRANDKGGQKDIVAASRRGRSHAHEGKPRDDHFKLHHNDENGWYVLAVADGAGSAKYSRKGSEIACLKSVAYCKEMLSTPAELEKAIEGIHTVKDRRESNSTEQRAISEQLYGLLGQAAFKAYKGIEEVTGEYQNSLRDFSTTLLLSICKKFDFGWFIASFQIGDGAIAVYKNGIGGYVDLLGIPDSGEYAGQTRFLTMPEIMKPEEIMRRITYRIKEEFDALFLMTDGVSDPHFEADADLKVLEKWGILWDKINKAVDLKDDNSERISEQLLEWLNFWSPGNHDDRTIAILY